MSFKYRNNPLAVKNIMDLRSSLFSLVYDPEIDEDFFHCHKHRNFWNQRMGTFDRLTQKGNFHFQDNSKEKNTWTLLPDYMNAYHKPSEGAHSKYSLKFLRVDNGPLQGEFELIVRFKSDDLGKNHQIIDGESEDKEYLSTYNFGRTISAPHKHYWLDLWPHQYVPNYYLYPKGGRCTVILDYDKYLIPNYLRGMYDSN